MKKKLPIIIVIISLLLYFPISTLFAALKSSPVAVAPITNSDFNTDLFTGSASYSYPISVPKGTNGLTPEILLSYNSSSAKDGSQRTGIGWDITHDFIERDVNYTPTILNDDKFKLHFKGAVHELVQEPGEDIYHTKIETHLRIKKFSSGGSNNKNEYWEITEKNGTKYRFGYQTQSELVCNTADRDYVKQWDLDLVTDTHDNKIYYTYTDNENVSYPNTITYNNDQSRQITFGYTPNSSQRYMYIQGCRTLQTSKLHNVQIKANGNVVREFDLRYVSAKNTTQLLSSIGEKGSTSSATLPPTKFHYNPQVSGFNATDDKWLNNVQLDYTDLDRDDTTLMDVNGDALPDIVRSYGASTITYKVWLNNGSTWVAQSPDWMINNSFDAGLDDSYTRLIDVTGDSKPDIVKAASADAWSVWRNTGSSWSTTEEDWGDFSSIHSSVKLSDTKVKLVDVTGDNLPDIVRSWWNGSPQYEVIVNRGNTWSGGNDIWTVGGISEGLDHNSVEIADANGDGLADLIRTTYSGTNATWMVYENTGRGWRTTHETWINNANIDAHLEKNNVTLSDVNGDGLIDIVRILDQGVNDKWEVLLNKGNSWSTKWETWITGVDADVEGEDNVILADVNGDTYPDILKSYLNSGGNVTWQVWKNKNHASDTLTSIKTSLGGWTSFEYASSSAAFDNKGDDDKPDLPFAMQPVNKMTVSNGMPGALGTVDVTSYSYQDGLYDWEDKEFRGFAVVETVEPNTAKKKYVFNQSDALKGLLAEVQSRDSSNAPYFETENTWSSSLSDGVYTVNMDKEKEYTYDGNENNPKVKETEYEYDNFGNVTKKSELGDTSVTGDERYIYNEYVYNTSLWIVDKLAHSTLKGSDNSTKVSEMWQFYDNDPTATSSASSPSASKFGDGSNGDITIAANTTEAPIDASVTATAASNSATVNRTSGFFTNQLVLFHQTQGTNAGAWEIARVESQNGTKLKLTTNLTNSYSSAGSNRAQIRVIPQYNDVTVNTNMSWNAKAWNGSTGGILAFLANGTVTVNGTINATGQGFRGGNGGNNAYGTQGEGLTGGGAQSSSANGTGGGAGGGGVWFGGGGGGAGGHGAGGAAGGHGGTVGYGGSGGNTAGTANLQTMVFGGAGGGGGSYYGSGQGGGGGKSGGIIFATAATLTVNSGGSITANGLAGSNSAASGDSGGGGGGAGGSVMIKAENTTLGASSISSVGGTGGSYNGSGGTGGIGSVGRIRIEHETTINGSTTTTPTASTNQTTISSVPATVITWSSNNTNLTKGDVTSEVKWLSGGTNPITRYEYDTYGNVKKVIDPKNNETTFEYGVNDATNTYPEKVINAKGHETEMTYDLGTGNLLSKTDPNNNTTTYTYDLFGRVLKEIKPYDTTTYPSLEYSYDFDGIAPENITIRKREESGTTNTVSTTTYVDGLNRKIQARADAEDATKQIVVDTYYDPTGEIKKETVPYLATASAMLASASGTKFGDGSDGDYIVDTNRTDTPIDSAVVLAPAGSTAVSVGSGLGFIANQIVLFHQTQGENAGTWELARVRSYSGTTLVLASELKNTYSSYGNDRAQVRVLPQYNDVTVDSGITWTAKAWNGSTGGIFAFLANGTVTVNGTINGKGLGFRGYSGHSSDYTVGLQAEGSGGIGNVRLTSSNGNGAGGGGYSNNYPWDQGNAGGGGGNVATGANGGTTGGGQNQGGAGGEGGTIDTTTLALGGAGGAGGTGDSSGSSGSGANGGAGVMILADTLSISGLITTEGNRGGDSSAYKAAGGGGGAAGSVLLQAESVTLGSNPLQVAGGVGGYHENSGRSDARGGTGANGRISIEYESSLIATISAATISQRQLELLPAPYTEFANLDPNARFTEYTYDPVGRVTIINNPKGDPKTIAYDHWKETQMDENGHIKRSVSNAYGKIAKVEEVINSITHSTHYSYNSLDLLTEIVDSASNSGTMTYDSLGRKTAHNDPDMGTWTYQYDAAGNQTNSTDARNITTTRTYDQLNRLTGVLYPNDTDIGYTYDIGKIGTLSIATDSAGTASYTYDDRLRKTHETRVIDGTSKTTQFAYDSADRVTSQTNPDSTTSTYTFNAQGEIDSLSGILSDVDYNAHGKITEKQFSNGLTTTYNYNSDDFRLNNIQTGTLQDLNYTYDKVGNITSIFNDVTDKTQTFSYDDLDRLKTATESAGFSYAYEYNPIGNLTKFTDGGKSTSYEYGEGNAGPHALTGQDFGESPVPVEIGGYNGEYFTNNSLSGSPLFTRTDTSINFDWEYGAPTASMSASLDNFSVRWTKTQYFDGGNYLFSTTTDDGVRVYIDDQLVINKWMGQSATHTGVKHIPAGNHTIKMEYYEGGGGAHAKFKYLKIGDGFVGEYFSNKTLTGEPTVVRNDPEINFDWDTASPAATIPFDNFSARWNKVASFSAGLYQFTVKGDDGIRLYVDEELVIDGWVDQAGVTYTTTKAMTAGDHRIRVEYYDSGWSATAQFTYEKVGEAFMGEYFTNQTLSGNPVATVSAATIDFDWGDNPPHASLSANQVSARWTKTENFAAGEYEFTITGDDGIRLFIDNVQVINGWYDQGSVSYTANQTLTAGNHDIRVEYYEAWGGAVAKFSMNKVDTNFTKNMTTNTSSVENNDSSLNGDKAVDGNTSTRWSSSASDPQWLAMDMGSRKTINRVKLNWHASYGSEYRIQMSEDGINWNTVKEVTWTNGNIDDLTGFYGTGRYIRLYGVQRATSGGYSVYEFEAYGATAPTLPAPTANPVIAYDANGNMTNEGIKCFTYNDANKLTRVSRCANNQTIAEYVYDYNGQRLIKKNFSDGTLNNTVISWSKSFETKAVVGGATETINYYFANNELLAKKNNDGSKVFFHNDHLGSNSLTTNQWGSEVEVSIFDPWGRVLSGATQSKFKFTGQEKDTETGLNYYGARYYNAELKRFTQPDTLLQNVYDPQLLNRYAYARNNPLKYTDPTGNAIVFQNGRIVSTLLPTPVRRNTVPSPIAPIANRFPAAAAVRGASSAPTRNQQQSNNSGGGGSSNNSGNNQPPPGPPNANLDQNIKEAENHRISRSFHPALVAKSVYNAVWFASKVNTKGDWDYKQEGYEALGNFNYGATGRAVGFTTYELQVAAGIIQIKTNYDAEADGDPDTESVDTAGLPFIIYPYMDASKSNSFWGGVSPDQENVSAGARWYQYTY